MKNILRNQAGMTLIEIMIVIVIIGLLTSIGGVAVFNQLKKAKVSSTRSQICEYMKALELYQLQVGKYPSSSEGLEALIKPSKGDPILKDKKVKKDAWGTEFTYQLDGNNPIISSPGADTEDGTEDDVLGCDEEEEE